VILKSITKFAARFFCCTLSLAACGQDSLGHRVPSITMSPPPIADVARGKANSVELRFHVGQDFHVNSNKPAAEYLIPTTLKLDPPTDIVVGRITYPPGQEMSFAFSPDEKLIVYSGSFAVEVEVRPLTSVLPGKYEIRGNLRYQACDNAQCFPPKNLPIQFEVRVVNTPRPARKNPGQSPHVHT